MERIKEKKCASCNVVKSTESNFAWLKTRFHSWCNDCKKEKKRLWYLENCESEKAKSREFSKKYYKENSEKIALRAKLWDLENPEKVKERSKRWFERHKDIHASNQAKRRASKRNACPKWLSKEQKNDIEKVYSLAKKLTIETGVEHEVDHIIPLVNSDVCGLHVAWNMRVTTRFDNRSKGNRLENQHG